VLFEHARGALLRAGGPRGRPALRRSEQGRCHRGARLVIALTARPEPRVVADQPHQPEHERGHDAGRGDQIEATEAGRVTGAAQQIPAERQAGGAEREAEKSAVREQRVVGVARRAGAGVEGDRAHHEDDDPDARARLGEEVRGARAQRHPDADADQERAEGEQRRLGACARLAAKNRAGRREARQGDDHA
jgi:hypothetical protein